MRLIFTIVRRFLTALTTGLIGGFYTALAGMWQPDRSKRGRDSDRDRRSLRSRCAPVDRPEYARPDPLIYAQYYLQGLGHAITWDNPDIQLYRDGAPASSDQLAPASNYEVVATIWNGSLTGPVVQMPVHFVYRDFGIGTLPIPIGTVKVSVGVKGGPGHPAFAKVPWTTPDAPGHYCLQVLLDPVDDINPLNNLGQENTNVGSAHSPALFHFALRNDTTERQRYRFETDAYVVGPRPPCGRVHKERARLARLARHERGAHPLPVGWVVQLDPAEPVLESGESVTVAVTVTPPPGFTGSRALNVHAFHAEGLAGGVTLTVKGG